MSIAAQAAKRNISINGVPLSGKVVTFNYYESLLSPFVSANLEYVDTGNTVASDRKNDPQERTGTLLSALPLRGNESVNFEFTTSLGSLSYKRQKMVVDGSFVIGQESQREGVFIRLLSPFYVTNKNKRVQEKHYNNVVDSAKNILTQHLNYPKDRIQVTPSKTSYAFTGSNRHPYDVLMDLASQSSPPQGDPGYFAFETKSGFHFKSIDNLVSQSPKETYFYNAAFRSDLKNDSNAFRILTPPSKKDQSISSSLRSGMYSATFRFMYDVTQVPEERTYNLQDNKEQKNLGKRVDVNPELKNKPSRIYTKFIPRGMMEKKINDKTNNDPLDYLARSIMRYNLLFVQAMTILVPCNPNLEAGDVIRCEFEKITLDSKVQGSYDIPQSGNYLILNLCHHYTSVNSFTSLTLVRDTYGQMGVAG